MKKQDPWLGSLAIFILAILVISPRAYADDTGKFNAQIKGIQTDRALMEAKLGIKPHVDNYDLADHYAEGHLVRDVMEDEGIC